MDELKKAIQKRAQTREAEQSHINRSEYLEYLWIGLKIDEVTKILRSIRESVNFRSTIFSIYKREKLTV